MMKASVLLGRIFWLVSWIDINCNGFVPSLNNVRTLRFVNPTTEDHYQIFAAEQGVDDDGGDDIVVGSVLEKENLITNGFDQEFEYSRCLNPKEERDLVMMEANQYSFVEKRSLRRKLSKKPLRFLNKLINPKGNTPSPGNLILVRAGESVWNADGIFTGWADPDLSFKGRQECEHAGRLLLEQGFEPDVVYTSRLKRAIHSAWVILMEIDAIYLPVFKSWRLNERHYGSLTGLSKQETAKKLGVEVVQAWRNSHRARPPAQEKSDKYYPGRDRRYADLSDDQIPVSESLMDCMERTRPLWEYKISKDLKKGKNVMVVAHGNTLRGLIKLVDGISVEAIKDVNMPTGIPFVYKFDENLNPILPDKESRLTQEHASGIFLEKPGRLTLALKLEAETKKNVPGLLRGSLSNIESMRTLTLEQSLMKLKQEQELARLTELKRKLLFSEKKDDTQTLFQHDLAKFEKSSRPNKNYDKGTPNIEALPPEVVVPGIGKYQKPNEAVVVLIRHGRTPHNNLGLFTGWEDCPLAEDGIEDAKEAGKILKRHGFEFDVVYSSWLNRAITTAWYVLDELDQSWLPVVKSWRLNERMYGALTGKSKKMIANIYGEDQLKKWRRGFTIRPPPVSSYSFSYPGNDLRKIKYVKDLRISWTETFCRSIEKRQFQVHRKFPKAESLKDCMDRSIPFYTQRIVPEAVNKGKRVLITSHENALRGILMHLCDIPEEAMNDLHLPNGLPLVYNVRRKCITLLDDGSDKDPMDIYDFGPAAKYLFRPCELDDEFFEKMGVEESELQTDLKEKVVR